MKDRYHAILGAALRECGRDGAATSPLDNTYATILMRTFEVFRDTRKLMLGDRPRMVDETFGDSTENEQAYDRAQRRLKVLNDTTRPKALALMRAVAVATREIATTPSTREAKRDACRALLAALDEVYEGIVNLGAPSYGTDTAWYVKRPVFTDLA